LEEYDAWADEADFEKDAAALDGDLMGLEIDAGADDEGAAELGFGAPLSVYL
jgi:hypothetical protein